VCQSLDAEENHNITLEWTFTSKPDTSISALKILCYMNNDHKHITLYFLHDGVEFSEDQDKKFSGRVQSDKDALREGQIRLQLSRLRTEDSGLYLCEVDTGYGRGYNSCRVTVSGKSHLVCPSQIVATMGDDVVLPCQLKLAVDANSETVEWTKPSVNPNIVHFHKDGRLVYENQNPSYHFRTRVFVDELIKGNVSLKIFNVKLSDEGTYRCSIPWIHEEASIVLTVGDGSENPDQTINKENHNITLEWTFTTKPNTSISALKILCSLNNDLTLYFLHDGVEVSEVQDEKFSGRVQSDKDALREGRIRLQLSRLRTEDSGLYLCEVDTGYGRGYNSCRVTVSGKTIHLYTSDHCQLLK
uniref:Ig-like domain-containing protein n=1 Tax=Neolamprologus brichardi TaxID=32507 RepID=A0A3Q4G6U9_NEOBR